VRSAGAAEAVSVVDGPATFTVNGILIGAVLLPWGIVIVSGEQVTPAGAPAVGQVITTGNALLNVPLGVTIIVDVPAALCPATVVTVAAVPPIVKLPVPAPIVPVKAKFKTLLPPKATGFGSAWPNELTMMK